MMTLHAGIIDVPIRHRQSVLMAVAVAATAVAAFVVCSLVLKTLAHLALGSLHVVEDPVGQSAEYVLISAVAMYAVRMGMSLARIRYQGRLIVSFFLAISVSVMTFALSSGIMRVDFLISLLRMSALCLFAYLQFWRNDSNAPAGAG